MGDKNKITAECGHETVLRGMAKAFGTEKEYQLREEGGKAPFCLKCLGDAAIRCAWCGKAIFPGDRVTLYTPTEKGFIKTQFVKAAYAVVHSEGKEGDASERLVGCMVCALKPEDIKGFWLYPGRVLVIQKKTK